MLGGLLVDQLGVQEKAVLAAISGNPFMGQSEIAEALGLARSTVAAHIVQLIQKGHILGRGYMLPEPMRVTCIGGATVDRKYHARRPLIPETSNPVEARRSFGGVARNVAENLVRLGVRTSLLSTVGDDENGRAVLRHLGDLGADVSQVFAHASLPTAEYVAVLGPDHDLVLGLADMAIFDTLEPAHLERSWPHLAASAWVFGDCNPSADVIRNLIRRAQSARFGLAVDAVSRAKVLKLPSDLSGIDVLFLNRDEAETYLAERGDKGDRPPQQVAQALCAAGAGSVVLTMGAEGLVVAAGGEIRHLPAPPAIPVDVTGAGDALIAGTLQRLVSGDDIFSAARIGARLAALTTETEASVHPGLSPGLLADLLIPSSESQAIEA
ncbi:pseudouridine kinase [Faunimonas pinastri]|uniref:Pseudouridine kinase n=2 Tax=Faunimonas pinastri TaxID=1855383 RepID=A0A1H9CUL2_9HYPH|nr:pseudouridine kinase [Faunimonas pinastri]